MNSLAFEFRHVTKTFFQTRALTDVSFSAQAGQVTGLIGENGAGKSTLMNVLGGVLQPDAGEMLLAGQRYSPQTPLDAAAQGIAVVHQELNLFANLSIAENLFLTALPCRRRLGIARVDRRELRRRAADVLETVGLPLDPGLPVARLSPGERQLVEIARAVSARPRVIVFDEPTTSLGQEQTRRLFDIIDRLRDEGTAVVYISHNLGDVLRLCDSIVVLRDGAVQAVRPAAGFTVNELISLMVGRSLQTLFPERPPRPRGEALLQAMGISQPGVVHDVSFTLHRGEVLGLSGLLGSGRTELARILFGLDPRERGQILVKGAALSRPTPRRCIQRGMGFLTEDRRQEGMLAEANIVDNVALVSLDQYAARPWGRIQRPLLQQRVDGLVRSLGVQCFSQQQQPVKTLSGGNQQKVVLAKWLICGADVLILDEPTRGVDVGAKADIYTQINRLVAHGAGVLLISSEMEELVGLCDRILVMVQGEIQSTVERRDFDRDEMLRSALGKHRLK